MTAGIGSILVAGAVWCFGLLGADGGWGGLVAGAFCVLAIFLGAGGLALGGVALRQIRRDSSMKGRGLAITGMICGGVGLLLAIVGVIVAIALAQGSTSAT